MHTHACTHTCTHTHPYSGVSDDVSRNPFGALTVDMIHYQPDNEVYWCVRIWK